MLTTFHRRRKVIICGVPASHLKEFCFILLSLPILPMEKYLIVISITFWVTDIFV